MIYFLTGLLILMGVVGSEEISLGAAVLSVVIGFILMTLGSILIKEKYEETE